MQTGVLESMPERHGQPLNTYSGEHFYPLDPQPAEIHPEDIAHGLANTCRYSGQCQHFYSVATHSLYVSQELEAADPTVQLYGLFHDAAEAYLGDVPRPFKQELGRFEQIEQEILGAVWDRLSVPAPTDAEWQAVMDADNRLFQFEADELLADFQPATVPALQYELQPCSPTDAREQFLTRVDKLTAAVSK